MLRGKGAYIGTQECLEGILVILKFTPIDFSEGYSSFCCGGTAGESAPGHPLQGFTPLSYRNRLGTVKHLSNNLALTTQAGTMTTHVGNKNRERTNQIRKYFECVRATQDHNLWMTMEANLLAGYGTVRQ